MNREIEKEETEVVVTLLSNGSSDLYKDNTLTHFSNKIDFSIVSMCCSIFIPFSSSLQGIGKNTL